MGVASVLFPPADIGLVATGAIGGVAGHVSGGMSRSDLKDPSSQVAYDASCPGVLIP